MGSGSFSTSSYRLYSCSVGREYDEDTGRTSGQSYTATKMDESLNPRNFRVRECVNCDEHPHTIPVILALDVTGSMGGACKETADALGVIMSVLYEKFAHIQFSIFAAGDLAYDKFPIQMSQFESDIRIAEALDKIFLERGGGGNAYESYSAAWYMGLKHTKLDAVEKDNRKGIIITLGDEPLNPYLPGNKLAAVTGDSIQGDIETNALYKEASKIFDIYHIAVDDSETSYSYYKERIQNSFGQLLGSRLKVSTIQNLAKTITECISDSIESNGGIVSYESAPKATLNENGEITW